MPETEGDIIDLLFEIGYQHLSPDCLHPDSNRPVIPGDSGAGYKKPSDLLINPPIVFLEQVGGFVGQAQPASSAFNFGHNAGFVRGVCMALGFRVELVRPQKWQAPLGLGSARAAGSKTAWKNKLKACAQRLFPGLKVTLYTADALLILDWGMREHKEIN